MSDSGAYIRNPRGLGDFCNHLTRFADSMQNSLTSIDLEITRTEEWLEERERYWRREIERRRVEVRIATVALMSCLALAAASRGEINCNDCEAMLQEAKMRLREAEEYLELVKKWQGRLRIMFEQFYPQALKLNNLSTNTTDKAKSYLRQKQVTIEKYHSIPLGVILSAIGIATKNAITSIRNTAVREARKQEVELVIKAHRGTHEWTNSHIAYIMRYQKLPKGYVGHHINNVQRFPGLANNPNNIRFVTWKQHFVLHHFDWHNNTSGKMYNRKSLMTQWVK